MIDQLISALKLSLAECKQYEDPREYTFQLNQVLNRYKTNLFKMMEAKERFIHDPKEFIQLRIRASWVTRRGPLSRVGRYGSILKEVSPTMLHIHGFIPVPGERRNKEQTFFKAVCIDDVIDLNRIIAIKTDHFDFNYKEDIQQVTENDVMNAFLGVRQVDLSMYHNRTSHVHDVLEFTMQLNGHVAYSVVRDHENTMGKLVATKGGVEPVGRKYTKKAKVDDIPATTIAEADKAIGEVEKAVSELRSTSPMEMMNVILAARTKGKPLPHRGL